MRTSVPLLVCHRYGSQIQTQHPVDIGAPMADAQFEMERQQTLVDFNRDERLQYGGAAVESGTKVAAVAGECARSHRSSRSDESDVM